MKKWNIIRALTILLGLVLLALLLPADSPKSNSRALSFQETLRGGQARSVGGPEGSILDMRGTIIIHINKDILRETLAQQAPVSRLLIDRIKALRTLLEKREESLADIESALSMWRKLDASQRDSKAIDQFVNLLKSAARPAANLLVAGGPTLARRFDLLSESVDPELLGNPIVGYRLVFEAGELELRALRGELDEIARTEGVYIQLGGWLDTDRESRPLHLPGFDENPVPDPYDPNPYKLVFDSAQLQELKSYAELAKNINAKTGNLASNMLEAVRALLSAALDQTGIADCTRFLASKVNQARSQAAQSAKVFEAELETLEREAEDFLDYFAGLKKRCGLKSETGSLSPEDFLQQSLNDIDSLVERIRKLQDQLQTHKDALERLLGSELRAAMVSVRDIANQAGNCIDTARKGAEYFKNEIQQSIAVFFCSRRFDKIAYEFSDRVFQLEFDKIPDKTELDLKNTGFRQAGDSLLVLIGAGTRGEKARELETARFYLYYTTWHPELKVGLIFASPIGQSALPKKFQAAPAYSIFFKKASRKNVDWNEIVCPGIGINVAALDFDNDESLELGLGAVLSVLRDYVQVGYGFNITQNKSYWFLGVRLPFPVGGSSGSIK
jgi:ElaB/YqjD/DUF883 family membrane-anchored ribosome-binding protein